MSARFRREDPGAALFAEWSACQSQDLRFSKRDSWDRMLRQGIMLLTRFRQDNRIEVRQPQRNLQIKFTREVAGKSDFVSYVDAIGKLHGKRCLLEWKTSSSRYREEPEGLLSLDPQLVCYSWITGIADVAQVVFVRTSLVEIQYLRTIITDEQREEFGRLVEQPRIRRIESAEVSAAQRHPLPQNPCSTCPYVGLCLGKQEIADACLGAASRS